MMRGTLAVSLAALLLLAGCARSSASGAGDTGIRGVVLSGPSCPVEQAGSPCPDRPLATELEVVRGSSVVATVRSGDDGRFRVALEPGVYTIRAASGGFPSLRPVQVRVPSAAYANITLTFDSGIR